MTDHLTPKEHKAADPRVEQMVVPIVCDRCGAVKRNAEGQTLLCSLKWRLTRRMVCPTCFAVESQMEALEKLVSWDDDEVPF